MTKTLEQLKYPIGQWEAPAQISSKHIETWTASIAAFPQKMAALTQDLKTEQLNTPYRPEGWTVKQVVHHCADSHINSLVRFKLALTEDTPTIRPYYEDRWAELPDSKTDDIQDALLLLKGLHAKWTILLQNLSESDLERTFVHPEHGKHFTLKETIGTYAWHCEHHLAHVRQALG
ncbi:MAG: YfiT family bacillithiol transferase [Chitinophagales bacterium]